jgi:hypothetical protein
MPDIRCPNCGSRYTCADPVRTGGDIGCGSWFLVILGLGFGIIPGIIVYAIASDATTRVVGHKCHCRGCGHAWYDGD